jgi:ZIP family zinc transporter
MMLGFAAGVMTAASFWSLLAPSIEMARDRRHAGLLPAIVGFMFGGGFLRGLDLVLPHLHPALVHGEAEGPRPACSVRS